MATAMESAGTNNLRNLAKTRAICGHHITSLHYSAMSTTARATVP
jgi:hypothetical protein